MLLDQKQLWDALNNHAIVSQTDAQGIITFVNQRFCDVSGYEYSELVGSNHRLLKSGHHPPAFYEEIWRSISQGNVWNGVICNRAKDGSFYWVESTITPLRSANDDAITGYLSIRTDVSDIVHQVKANEDLATELRQLAEKRNQLFGMVAHELRTPVAAIAMMTTELDDSEWILSRKRIHQGTTDLLYTIDDMRMMIQPNLQRPVRIEKFVIQEINASIASSVASIVASTGVQYRQFDAIPLSFNEISFSSDAYRVRAAIINIVKNGCLHSEGSRVWVLSRLHSEGEGRQFLEWLVGDDGIGLEQDQISRLFEAGERGNSKSEGSGFGLYITKSWIEEIGGSVIYRSRPQGGSEFLIRVPLDTANPDTTSAEDRSSDEGLDEFLASLNVLVVEDETVLRMLKEKLLSRIVKSVRTAENGRIGLSIANNEFDLILTDYFMPEMSGVEMTKRLRARGYGGVVIGITAATIGEQRQDLLDAGANMVLPKPLNAEMFKNAISQLREQGLF